MTFRSASCHPPGKLDAIEALGYRLKRTAKVWRFIRVMNLFDMGICFEDLLCDLAVAPAVCDWRVLS
jgi:hypothetical protein